MKRASSLQWRLCLGLALGITLLWLAATLAASLVVQRELNEAFDSALEETAQRLLPLAVVEIINRETPGLAQQIAPLQAHDEYLTYLVRDSSGAILLRSHDADPAVFNAHPQAGFSSTASHRLYAVSALRETLFIEVAAPLAHRRAAALKAALAILLPLLLLIPLSVLGTWLLVRRSLRHVLAYGRAIEVRGVGDLSAIEAAQLPAEIAPLAEAVNQLMARLRRALEAERSFTANSAHELRTPMATALAQIQRLRREAPEGPLQTRAAQIEDSLRELARLSEKLMQLAKAEGGGLLAQTPHDLRPLLEHVVADLRRSVGERLRLTLPETAVLASIDADAFAILLRNLIENACKHGDAQQPVEVSLSAEGRLRVVNAGPAVPASVLAQLTERFVRGNSAATGSGLGLAIAQTISQGVGARLALVSPVPGGSDGFEASVQFTAGPVAPAPRARLAEAPTQIRVWISAMRLCTLPLGFSCIALGGLLAAAAQAFRWEIAALCVLTAVFLQILSNLANDYGDALHGADHGQRQGPARAVQSGQISAPSMRRAMWLCAGLAAVSGLALLWLALGSAGWRAVLAFVGLGGAALWAALRYTVGRSPYGYAGWGDLFVLIFFGWVGVLGSYFLIAQRLDWLLLLPASSCGLLAVAVLNVNNIRDIASDRQAGKLSIAVRVGPYWARVYHWALLGSAIALAALYVGLIGSAGLADSPGGRWLFVLALPLLLRNGLAVQRTQSPSAFNPLLKQMVLAALAFNLLLGVGLLS